MIRHLHDVAGLELLEQVAREHDVDLIARGGLARRLYALAVRRPEVTSPDLFALLPFTADIDLTHTGGPELTTSIMAAIRREVPLAECFRWDVRSAADEREAGVARAFASVVPIHAVTVGVRAGFDDPLDARSDIERRRHRYTRNAEYPFSPRYRVGRDLEVFGAIRYLRTIFEDEPFDAVDESSFADVRATIGDAMRSDTIDRLRESTFLRARLHALLKALAVELRTPASRAAAEESLLREFVTYVDHAFLGVTSFDVDLRLDAIGAITASEHLGADTFRLPPLVPFIWPTTSSPRAQHLSPQNLLRDDVFNGPGVQPVRVSPWVAVAPGDATASRADDGVANEMISFALVTDGDPGDVREPPNDEDLGILMLFKRGIAPELIEVASPLASCVSRPFVRDDGTTTTVRTFRLACGSLIERMARSDERGTLHVAFVVAARSVEEEDPDRLQLDVPTLVGRQDYDEQLMGAT